MFMFMCDVYIVLCLLFCCCFDVYVVLLFDVYVVFMFMLFVVVLF